MSKDLYSILEIPRTADQGDIRKAYMKLAKQYHPDKASEGDREQNEMKFKEIGRAYEILSDDSKKSFYDQTGQIPGEQDSGPQPGGFSGGFGMPPFPFDMNGLFGMFQGGGGGNGGRPGPSRGRRPGKAPPRKTQIALTLKDFYMGRTIQIHLDRQRFCGVCKGEGALHVNPCGDCHGSGVKRQLLQIGPGMMMDASGPCMTCRGSGKSKGDSCTGCKGSKFVKQDKVLELIIQKGMKVGDVLTFPGESSQVEDWEEPGDLLVELIAADEESEWERMGDTLRHRVGLTLGESLCGKTIRLEGHPAYPEGLFIHIPSGIMNRQEITVEGCGMPRTLGTGFGDCILILTVMPTKEEKMILESQKELFQGIFKVGTGETVPSTSQLKYAKPIQY